MVSNNLTNRIYGTKRGPWIWAQEKTILSLTELISQIMRREGVTRSQLAKRLGTSKSHVTQLLDGSANMTVRTSADVFTALGYELVYDAKELEKAAPVFEQSFVSPWPKEEDETGMAPTDLSVQVPVHA